MKTRQEYFYWFRLPDNRIVVVGSKGETLMHVVGWNLYSRTWRI
jgi:hypothetical protein